MTKICHTCSIFSASPSSSMVKHYTSSNTSTSHSSIRKSAQTIFTKKKGRRRQQTTTQTDLKAPLRRLLPKPPTPTPSTSQVEVPPHSEWLDENFTRDPSSPISHAFSFPSSDVDYGLPDLASLAAEEVHVHSLEDATGTNSNKRQRVRDYPPLDFPY